jgi:hypothetical protein
MTPLEVVKQAEGTELRDEDGNVTTLKLLPPLSEAELRALGASLPCPLPAEARELFACSRGFEGEFGGMVRGVEWSGQAGGTFGLEEVFPHAVPIADDATGNFWVVDLVSDSTSWGPIYYACHDAPVIVFQTDSLAHFISELLRLGIPPWQSEIREVHDEHESRIWSDNPGMMTHARSLASGDADLAAFAGSLDESWLLIDLRHPRLGEGFSWGRYGSRTANRRFGEQRLFAYQQRRRSLWERLTDW